MHATLVAEHVAPVIPSCYDLLDCVGRSSACPGCGVFAIGWTRVDVDGLSILTHDGDLICPNDATFGYSPCVNCSEIPCSCAISKEVPQTDRAQTFTPVTPVLAEVAA
ncbi:hypothetical protein [Streptomyces sp. NPDC001815]|uniref:hypothetical protein n=1 Tax=Streptomyces sp. NPDC001815 TaxID=3154526 RepID=UPI0033208B3D